MAVSGFCDDSLDIKNNLEMLSNLENIPAKGGTNLSTPSSGSSPPSGGTRAPTDMDTSDDSAACKPNAGACPVIFNDTDQMCYAPSRCKVLFFSGLLYFLCSEVALVTWLV